MPEHSVLCNSMHHYLEYLEMNMYYRLEYLEVNNGQTKAFRKVNLQKKVANTSIVV